MYCWTAFRKCVAVATLALAALTPRADITTSLIAHWRFDETTGVTATDSSARANHATLFNFQPDDSMWVTGRIGGALAFNPPDGGDDDQVVTDNVLTFDNQDTFTFAFWARRLPGDNPFNPRFITPTTAHWVLWTPGTGVGFFVPAPTADPAQGAWTHYVIVYDRAGSRYSVYVDGIRVVNNATAARAEPGETQWVIGHNEDLSRHLDPWRGFLDDMRIYNRLLSESDIQELYALAGAVPPRIVTAPQNVSKFLGDTVRLTVVAEGTAPLRYQWRKGTDLLVGETNTTFVITNAQLTHSGSYSVVVSNSLNSVTSPTATVQITDPPVDITTGLILHYAFDDTNSFAVTDSSGRGNNGTLNQTIGDGSEWVQGRIGGALRLNPPDGGNDDYVITDNVVTLNNQDNFTFSFWTKLAPGSGVNPRIITPTTGHWVLWTPNVGVGFFTPAPSPQPLLDLWRHFAVSYDRTSGVYQLFVDGQRVGTEVSGRSRSAPGESQWIVGHSESLASNADAFAGALDDLRVYNRHLSAKDIAALYALAANLSPTIISAPTNRIVPSDDRLVLTVVAEGTSLQYQWKKDGGNIIGETKATLTFASTSVTNSGNYSVAVSNSLSQVETTAATITIVPVLNLTNAPALASTEYDANLTATRAFDRLRLGTGPNSSRWASLGGGAPQWLYVDLGEDMSLKHVFLDWEAAYAATFTLRGRTSAEGPTTEPTEWTELASVIDYAQASHGVDGPDLTFNFVNDRILLHSATVEPVTAITSNEPRARYLMLDAQVPGPFNLVSVWELHVSADPANAAPQLTVLRTAIGITIRWPESITGYVLESTPTLPATSWTAVTGVVNNSVTVPTTGSTMYYRLRRSP